MKNKQIWTLQLFVVCMLVLIGSFLFPVIATATETVLYDNIQIRNNSYQFWANPNGNTSYSK